MTGTTETFQATLMHAPNLGSIETIEDALVEVAANGKILAVFRPGEPDYEPTQHKADAEGSLHRFDPGHFLLPGLVDLHIHAPQWPMMGKSLHLPLYEWLEQHTFPLEARYADVDFAQEVYSSLVDALLANGTTTAVYFGTIHNPANQALAEICLDRGQRAFVGKVAMDDVDQCPDYYRDESAALAIRETGELIEFIRKLPENESALVKPIVTPRFIPSCTDELLEGLGALARETDCHIQTHCSESDWQHAFVKERCGKSDSTALQDFGLLTRKTVLAHSNHITEDDCETIKAAGAGIAHCPLSNFYFANAVFPLRSALEKELHVGLGTDISAGPSPSIFDSCRQAVTASRVLEDGVEPKREASRRGREQARIDFRHAFWLATAGGGEVLDIPVGKFAPGYHFDAMAVDINAAAAPLPTWADMDGPEEVLQKIIYSATRANIAKVWVAGREVG